MSSSNGVSVIGGSSHEEGRLFSTAMDQTIRIWSLSTYTCLHVISLTPEVGNVSCPMHLFNHGQELWIGTEQGIVQVFDSVLSTPQQEPQSLFMTRCHGKDTPVAKLEVSGGKLITCAKDHTIQIKEITAGERNDMLVTSIVCTRGVQTMIVEDGRVYAGGLTVRTILL
jgi:WD40 repeat protein